MGASSSRIIPMPQTSYRRRQERERRRAQKEDEERAVRGGPGRGRALSIRRRLGCHAVDARKSENERTNESSHVSETNGRSHTEGSPRRRICSLRHNLCGSSPCDEDVVPPFITSASVPHQAPVFCGQTSGAAEVSDRSRTQASNISDTEKQVSRSKEVACESYNIKSDESFSFTTVHSNRCPHENGASSSTSEPLSSGSSDSSINAGDLSHAGRSGNSNSPLCDESSGSFVEWNSWQRSPARSFSSQWNGPASAGQGNAVDSELGNHSSAQTDDNNGYSSLSSEETFATLLGESSRREARRNSGRRFWDALTRAAMHRRTSAPITIVAIEEIDESGASTNRWNFQHLRAGALLDAGALSSHRNSDFEERRRGIRSQVWALEEFSDLGEMHGFPRTCSAARHHLGLHCSCENHSQSEDTNTRASISRIIMLAEALFEVLNEIHRQSASLSESANAHFSCVPATQTVVDSLPIRIYRKCSESKEDGSDDSSQCYICLSEYEEDDQVRVLPCRHEYHKGCVDKWLKEVHRICPLCRRDICEIGVES